MVARNSIVCVAGLVIQLGCSSDTTSAGATGGASAGGASSGGATSTAGGTTAITGAGGQAGHGAVAGGGQGGASSGLGGGTSATQNCSTWPTEKLFPIVGIYFYGPNPGPCTITSQGVIYTLTYNSSNQVVSKANADNSDVTTYSWDQGLLVSESQNRSQIITTTTYQYSANSVSYVISSDPLTIYTFTLDSRGYPQTVTVGGRAVAVTTPTHYSYVYDNCRITQRIAFSATNMEIASGDVAFNYDAQGHLIERTSATFDETYDYSCW